MTTDMYLRKRELDVAKNPQVIVTEGIAVYEGTEYNLSDKTTRKCLISISKQELLWATFVEFLGTLFYVCIATNSGTAVSQGFVLTSLMIAFGKIRNVICSSHYVFKKCIYPKMKLSVL